MRTRFPIGAQVALKNPLPHESRGPWRIAGVKLRTVPLQYLLARNRKGMAPAQLTADENELELYDRARHEPTHSIEGKA